MTWTYHRISNKHINPTHFSMAEIMFRFTITQFQPLKNAQVMQTLVEK